MAKAKDADAPAGPKKAKKAKAPEPLTPEQLEEKAAEIVVRAPRRRSALPFASTREGGAWKSQLL